MFPDTLAHEVNELRAENERLRAALEAIAELSDPATDTASLIAHQALNRNAK